MVRDFSKNFVTASSQWCRNLLRASMIETPDIGGTPTNRRPCCLAARLFGTFPSSPALWGSYSSREKDSKEMGRMFGGDFSGLAGRLDLRSLCLKKLPSHANPSISESSPRHFLHRLQEARRQVSQIGPQGKMEARKVCVLLGVCLWKSLKNGW